MTLLLAPFA